MKFKKIITIFIILIMIFTTISLTLGKYIYNSVWDYYLTSKEFYFESDLLDINIKNNSLLKWDGSDVYFKINNSQNAELVSEYDIKYKITCEVIGDESDYIDCVLNGSDSNVYSGTLSMESFCKNNIDSNDVSNLEKTECEINGYTWYDEVAVKENYFNLKLTDENKNLDEVTIKITAESLTPYNKKLIGVFNLNKLEQNEPELTIDYQTYDAYDELIFTNLTFENKCLEISFDTNNYIIDLDDKVSEYLVNENNQVNKISVQILKQDSEIKRFYKKNKEKKYSIDDFSIENKEC